MTQNTISKRVAYETCDAGVVTICPAAVNSGIRFVRRDTGSDASDAGVIPADWRNARSRDGDLDLVNGEGVFVRKVSRLLAALKVSGINNATVEVEMEVLDIDSAISAACWPRWRSADACARRKIAVR